MMKTNETGYVLLFKNNELCDFERVSIELDRGSNAYYTKKRMKCLNRYCDLLGASNDIDLIYQFGDYTIGDLRQYGYKETKENGTFVYIGDDEFKSIFGDILTEEEVINTLRKYIFEHAKFSLPTLCEALSKRKEKGLRIQDSCIDDESRELMSQEEFNNMMLKLDEIKKRLELRQDPFEAKTRFEESVIEVLNKINKSISEIKSTSSDNSSSKNEADSKKKQLEDLMGMLDKTIDKLGKTEKSTTTNKQSTRSTKSTGLPPISSTVKNICQSVIGQDEPVRKAVLAVYNNLDLITKNISQSELVTLKNNILISGKSGCGKTEIARQIAANFSIPVCIEDITQYTGSGWAGKELSELLKRLFIISNRNLEAAQRGVLVIDEVDKISMDKSNDRHSHNTLEVQQGLLKIIEGGVTEIDMGMTKVPFDTRYLTVIGTGAFNGYNRDDGLSSENKYFLKQDYIDYGLMPEFVGRFKTFITLNELSFEDKKRILMESKLSVLNLKLADLEARGIKVILDCDLDKLCEAIIRKSEELSNGDCGVRDFNEIAFNMFSEIYYKLYDGANPVEIRFKESIVDDPKQITLRMK